MISAAFWSAIAASLAASTSLAIYLVHRKTLYQQSLPELVLIGLERDETEIGDKPATRLRFGEIRNVGKGSALYIRMHGTGIADDSRPTSISSPFITDILESGSGIKLDHELLIFWNNVALKGGKIKAENARIELMCRDTIGDHVHITEYNLVVTRDRSNVGFDGQHLGVHISRNPKKRSIFLRRLKSKILSGRG